MRGRDRYAKAGGSEDRGHRTHVGGHAGRRMQRGDLEAHGLDDLPTTPDGAEGDGAVRRHLHPERHADVAVLAGGKVPGADEQRGDHTHGLLRVVGAVTEGDRTSRHELQPLERLGVVGQAEDFANRGDQEHREERDSERHQRAGHDRDQRLLHARPVDRLGAPCRQAGADKATDERMARRRRHADPPRRVVPRDRGEQCGEDDRESGDVGVDRLGDRVGYGRADDEDRREVEEGREPHGPLRGHGPGGDDGRHRVRRIVEAIGEVEQKG